MTASVSIVLSVVVVFVLVSKSANVASEGYLTQTELDISRNNEQTRAPPRS